MDNCLVHCDRDPRRGDFRGRIWKSLAKLGIVLAFIQFCVSCLNVLCFKMSLFIFQLGCVNMFSFMV